MTNFIAFLFLIICFAVLIKTRWKDYFKDAHRGTPLEDEPATLFDVRDLLIDGDREEAIELYCEIFNTNWEEAQCAVAELEKNIKI